MFWRRLMKRPLVLVMSALVMGMASHEGRSQSATASAGSTYSVDAVRAAYLLNFIRFTEWPAESITDLPFTIGVAANRDLEDRLIKLTEGKQLQGGRRIRIRRLLSLADALECQLIYIHAAPRTDTSPFSTIDWIQAVRGTPVLTVAQESGFLQKGGMINFYPDGQYLRFEISPRAAEAVGLQLSSRVLTMARIVNVPPSPAAP
jgi:hypothetical protein